MAAFDRPIPVLRQLGVSHWTHGASEPGGRSSEGIPTSKGGSSAGGFSQGCCEQGRMEKMSKRQKPSSAQGWKMERGGRTRRWCWYSNVPMCGDVDEMNVLLTAGGSSSVHMAPSSGGGASDHSDKENMTSTAQIAQTGSYMNTAQTIQSVWKRHTERRLSQSRMKIGIQLKQWRQGQWQLEISTVYWWYSPFPSVNKYTTTAFRVTTLGLGVNVSLIFSSSSTVCKSL